MSQLNPTVNLQFVDPRAAMEEALARLDPEQRAISDEIMAVDPQPLVALAGAGSGKSETMVTTVARILLDNVLSSTDVIVTTFTNKAREELDSRLQAMVPAVKRDGLRLGTFHALAQRWMRAADPQMPSHRWDNARNVDLIDEDDSQRTAGEVVRLRERIVTGIQRAGDRPNLRDHGWKAIVFLAAETSNESVARRVFTAREVFGDSSGKVFRRLWGLVGIPDAASIWRRVLGDWEIPGLELEGQTQYEKTLGREIPKFRRGLDVIVPNGRSARDYAGQVEIMRGKGWGPDSPEAQPTLDALDAVGYRKIRQGWRLYEEVKATFNAFDFGDVLEAYWLRGEDKARLVLVDECFPGDTPILLADGSTRPIQQIVEDGSPVEVLSWDPETKQQVKRFVVGRKKVLLQKPTVRITAWLRVPYPGKPGTTMRQRRVLVVTADHRLFRWDGTEVPAGEIRPGDRLHFESMAPQVSSYANKYKHGAAGKARLREGLASRVLPLSRGGKITRRGGNGSGLTVPQETLLAALGETWEAEYVIPTGHVRDGSGYPTAYKVDLAKASCKVAIELDGGSHRSARAQEKDQKKTTLLESLGWTVHRFGNVEAVRNADRIAADLRDVACPIPVEVESVEDFPIKDFHVYDLSVEGTHRYYANGFLVHNCQDNNFVQLDVARKVAERGGGKLCLIGDVRQAIYSFRGADPEVTARAPETIGAKVMEITTNYRSGQEIVRLGNAIAEGKSWAYGSPSRSGRRGQDGLPVPGAISATGYADPLEEARATAVLAREEILRGTSPSEVAVLTRTNAAAGVYELGFLMEQVPVMVLGSSVSFFERGVVKDALAFLILAEGYGGAPERLASLMRIWKTPIDSSKPFHFLGEGTFKAEAQAYAELATLPMMDAIIQSGIFTKDPSWRKSGEALRSALNRLCLTPWPERAKDVGRLLTNPPYLSKESSPEDLIDPEAVQQVDALASIAERFDNLTELLAFTRRIANSVLFFEGEDRMTKKQRAEWDAERKRRVVVSTVHKAKGLGWSRVFVSATSGIFPGPRASEEDMPEEERVFYVAATRAKLTVDFTWAEKAGEFGGGPSPFIENFVLPLTDAAGKLPPGWRLVSRFPLRYERADGVYVDLISEEGSHTLKATGAEIEPQVFGSQLDALDAVTDFLKALPLVEDEALEDAQHAEEPVNPQGLSDADGVFLTYLRTLTGEAAPGVTWVALADLLLADGILRGAVLAEVRQVVAARVEPEPDEIKERRIAAVLDTEVLSRAPVWVTLPGYPYLADRAGSGSLVADGRWVTVARPWRGAENPALLRVGSTVVLDFPMPDGTEWRSYQINEAGTPVPGASYLARPGKAGHEEFYASVHKAKAAVWSRDELAQWLVEHPLSDEEAKDARYLYEAAAGLPIQVTKGKVEVPEADFDFQGRPRARLLNGIPVSRLAPLVEHGLLLQTGKGSYAISIGSAAPPAPKVAPPPAKK